MHRLPFTNFKNKTNFSWLMCTCLFLLVNGCYCTTQFSVPMKKNWYEDTLYQDAQDPNAEFGGIWSPSWGTTPWSCPAFYVQKNAELERGVPRLVINYKPLNKVLEWIRYPIPNKQDLINRLSDSVIFSKFDLKSGFWQI